MSVVAPELPGAEIAGTAMTEEAWLELRNSGLGGSEIAGILGISPWDSAYTVWARKLGTLPPVEMSEPMRWGHVLEQPIAEEWSQRSGVASVQPAPITIYRSKAHPIALSSPDRLTEDGTAWVEIKNVGSYKLEEWDDGVPDYYWVQAQWQLLVGGLDLCHVVALVGGQDLRWRRIYAEPGWQDMALAKAAEFWGHVESGTPPEIDGSDATKRAIAAEFAEKTTEPVEGGSDLALLVAEYRNAHRAEKDAASAKTLAQNRIARLLREHEVGTVEGTPVVSIKTIHRRAYSSDVGPSDYPKLTILKGGRAL